jgi:hypothetical protein
MSGLVHVARYIKLPIASLYWKTVPDVVLELISSWDSLILSEVAV